MKNSPSLRNQQPSAPAGEDVTVTDFWSDPADGLVEMPADEVAMRVARGRLLLAKRATAAQNRL